VLVGSIVLRRRLLVAALERVGNLQVSRLKVFGSGSGLGRARLWVVNVAPPYGARYGPALLHFSVFVEVGLR